MIGEAWLNDFLAKRGLVKPDGRPIYAFLCSNEEFDVLRKLLSGERKTIGLYITDFLHSTLPNLDRLFVLFCAEWWRRNYAGGPWKWQPIFGALTWPELQYQTRSRFVENGLGYWKRGLLMRGGDRGFLLTLACEGGLPVNLIRNDTGFLRAFLRAVLRDYSTYNASGVNATELAGIHLNYLPSTLQQPIVQEFAGILIEKIWELQNQVPQGANPVAELDQLDSSWRQRLPIVIEDDAANALVTALLHQAIKNRKDALHRLRIVRRLVRIGNEWQLQAELQLPATISRNVLMADTGIGRSLGERLELRLYWGEKFVRIASLLRQEENYNVYPLDRRNLQIRENVETEISCFVYERGKQAGQLLLRDGNALANELPLIFVDREAGGQDLEFHGQGSISTSFSEVYVLAYDKPGEVCANGSKNECELIAERVRVFEREAALYRLSGEFTVDLDDNVCAIRTRQQQDSEVEYRFEGRRDYLVQAKWPVFVGLPRVKRIHENISANCVRHEELYWSKATGRKIWQKLSEASPRGLVDFRHVRNGECLFSGRVIVLPEEAEIKLEPSVRSNVSSIEGSIVLRKLEPEHVLWQEQQGLVVNKCVEDECIFLRCSAQKTTVGKINLKLTWPDDCCCDFVIPFPADGGRFVAPEGRVISKTEYLPLDELFGHSAIALSLRGNQHFYIQGELQASDVDNMMLRNLNFTVSLPALAGNASIHELPLYELYHELLRLFNYSSDRDAIVKLSLVRQGFIEARVQVRQFSAAINFDSVSKKLHIEPEEEEMVAALNHDSIELLPLKDPEAPSLWLSVHDGENSSWPLSHKTLEQGPWLAVTSKEIRRRYRPRLVPSLSQPKSPITAEAGLREIIAEPDYKKRIEAMHRLFKQMEDDLNHEQWPVLFSYVERFATVHPNCLDWITVAVEHPSLLVGLLLTGGTNIFEIVYEWQEYLPFKWWMIPIRDWQAVIHAQLEPLRDDSDIHPIIVGQIERSLRKLNERNSNFGIMLEYLLTEVLQAKPSTSVLEDIKKRGVDKYWTQLERGPLMFLRRDKAASDWPSGMDRNTWNASVASDHYSYLRWFNDCHGYERAALDAPLAVAYFSVVGKYPQKSWRCFLTAYREFHPYWFDTAFHAVQAILLTQLGRT